MGAADRAPQIVIDLAASVNGEPLAWKEYDDHWNIVMTDGRKYAFRKDAPLPRKQDTLANYAEGAIQNANVRPDGSPRRARKKEE
ncbi:MAG TPA: hypothetical protein VIU40_08810 [Geobacteraceae bacterium]